MELVCIVYFAFITPTLNPLSFIQVILFDQFSDAFWRSSDRQGDHHEALEMVYHE
jgi:hypothetical protein